MGYTKFAIATLLVAVQATTYDDTYDLAEDMGEEEFAQLFDYEEDASDLEEADGDEFAEVNDTCSGGTGSECDADHHEPGSDGELFFAQVDDTCSGGEGSECDADHHEPGSVSEDYMYAEVNDTCSGGTGSECDADHHEPGSDGEYMFAEVNDTCSG